MRLAALPLLFIAASVALVDPPRAEALELNRKYEDDLIRWAMKKEALTPEPKPEGMVIERVVIVREEIIAASDPWPNFLNFLHRTTRDHVVRQELLVGRGDAWDVELVRESERNLRKLFILAVARTRACKGSSPDKVVLLVATKDLWSIRLNTQFSMVGTTLQLYDFFPTEQNFLGLNKRVSLHLQLRQLELSTFMLHDSFSLGNLYLDERVLGSRVRLTQRFDAIISGDVPCGGTTGGKAGAWCPARGFGELEGVYGYIWLERPLFSLATKWGFSLFGLVDTGQVRSYVQQPGPALRTVSLDGVSSALGTGDRAPRVYDRGRYEVFARVTRSLGEEIKHNISGGLSAYRWRYSVPDGFPFDKEVEAWFRRNYMPRSESAAYLYASYRTHRPKFIKVKNIETLGLTEDITLGHDVSVEVRAAAGLADFEPLYLEVQAEAKYVWNPAGHLLSVRLAGQGRWQPALEDQLEYGDPWANAIIEAEVREITPRVPGGRFHLRLGGRLRHNDLTRARSYLGGDDGLRGFASQQFEGDNLLHVNAEFRSLPINILTLHVGFVLFYDGGAVWGGPDPERPGHPLELEYHQSLGLGLRALFPQFDREPLRIDFGIPLKNEGGSIGTWFSLSFKQAF